MLVVSRCSMINQMLVVNWICSEENLITNFLKNQIVSPTSSRSQGAQWWRLRKLNHQFSKNQILSPTSSGGLPSTERLLFSTSKPRILEMTLLIADYMNMMGANLPKAATRSTIHSRSVSRTRLQVTMMAIMLDTKWSMSKSNTKYRNKKHMIPLLHTKHQIQMFYMFIQLYSSNYKWEKTDF